MQDSSNMDYCLFVFQILYLKSCISMRGEDI
jgi:hypothetical protein